MTGYRVYTRTIAPLRFRNSFTLARITQPLTCTVLRKVRRNIYLPMTCRLAVSEMLPNAKGTNSIVALHGSLTSLSNPLKRRIEVDSDRRDHLR